MIMLSPLIRNIRNEIRAVSTVEFALVLPLLMAMLLSISYLGILFFTQAGLKSSVEDAARFSTVWPTPSEAAIAERIKSNNFAMAPGEIVGPTITFSENQAPNYVTITMGYDVDLNYFFGTKTIRLSESRQAFVDQ